MTPSILWPWALFAAAVAATIVMLPVGIILLGAVAVVAHLKQMSLLRLVATLAFGCALLALTLGAYGGSSDGGLIDNP